jgi:hypothetical protein
LLNVPLWPSNSRSLKVTGLYSRLVLDVRVGQHTIASGADPMSSGPAGDLQAQDHATSAQADRGHQLLEAEAIGLGDGLT